MGMDLDLRDAVWRGALLSTAGIGLQWWAPQAAWAALAGFVFLAAGWTGIAVRYRQRLRAGLARGIWPVVQPPARVRQRLGATDGWLRRGDCQQVQLPAPSCSRRNACFATRSKLIASFTGLNEGVRSQQRLALKITTGRDADGVRVQGRYSF